MRIIGLCIGLSTASMCFGATWNGVISDSACGASHAKMMAEHKDLKTDRDCTLACIKGGSKYVFVSGGKVYKITNQNNSDLLLHAGHRVILTGNLEGDSITISKIDMRQK